MAKEIERKYLVANDKWRERVSKKMAYKQGYLHSSPDCSIRIRVCEDKANLNIKSATPSIVRDEYEYPIPADEAYEMLETLCRKPLIEKTRHHIIEHDSSLWEIDVFNGENEGLILAEIELQSVEQNFAKPDWLGKEVSDDPRYYNLYLIERPYKSWTEN